MTLNTFQFIIDIVVLILTAPLTGALVGWAIRHARKVVDARLTWSKPVYEQIEDMVTFTVAFALGALAMVAGGLAYVWWFFNYLVIAYPTLPIVQFVQPQPIFVIGYWAVWYFVTHMAVWFYHQGRHDTEEGEK